MPGEAINAGEEWCILNSHEFNCGLGVVEGVSGHQGSIKVKVTRHCQRGRGGTRATKLANGKEEAIYRTGMRGVRDHTAWMGSLRPENFAQVESGYWVRRASPSPVLSKE